MSKAIRCDRCKKCFDPYNVEGDFARITDFVVTDAKIFDSHECSYRDENIDLCPDCLTSFGRWLHNYSDTITTADSPDLDRAYDVLRRSLIQRNLRKNSTSLNEKDGV